MLDIQPTNNGFEVSFQYKPWLVAAIKQIPGVKFNGGKKNWWVPESSGTALLNWAKGLNAKVAATKKVEIGDIDPLPELTVEIPMKRTMFPYQANGVAYNLIHERVIIGDEPGLGKTGQSIATMLGAGAKCILVICPATLKENWKVEIEQKWTWDKAMILNDRVKTTWPQYYKVGIVKWFIINYESLKKFFVTKIDKVFDENGKQMPLRLNHIHFNENISLFDGIIIDEIHRCKDGKTQTSKFCMGVARGKKWVLGLTGTPVMNKPNDLIPQLHIINHLHSLGGYKYFNDRYCDGPNGSSNLKELNFFLNKNCFYRRLKKDVLKDLPDKIRSVIKVDITNMHEYLKAEEHFIEYLRENLKKSEGEIDTALRGQIMVQIGILKKIAARGKVEAIIEAVEEVTDAGEKLVLFAWHKEIVHELKKYFPKAVSIVGDDDMETRNRSVYEFQKCKKCGAKFEDHDSTCIYEPSDTGLIVCNIKSGGVGITLTAASRVYFIELPWNSAQSDQCEDRCHRISQKDSVQAGFFLGRNTIDEYIYDIIEKKRLIANEVTGDESVVETSVINEFINVFTKDKF